MPIEITRDPKQVVTFKDLKIVVDEIDRGLNKRLDRIEAKIDLLFSSQVKPNGHL